MGLSDRLVSSVDDVEKAFLPIDFKRRIRHCRKENVVDRVPDGSGADSADIGCDHEFGKGEPMNVSEPGTHRSSLDSMERCESNCTGIIFAGKVLREMAEGDRICVFGDEALIGEDVSAVARVDPLPKNGFARL